MGTFSGGLVDEEFAASYLAISRRHVAELRRSGRLTAVRVGGRLWRFTVADLDAYIESLPTSAEAS